MMYSNKTIEELIKTLTRELYNKAKEDIKVAESLISQDQMLTSVLDSAITSSRMTTKSQHKTTEIR